MQENLQIKNSTHLPKMLGTLFFFLSCFSISFGQLVINEYLPDGGNYDGQGAEWIELYCDGGVDCDASCFVITDGEEIVVIPDGTLVPAGGFLMIYNSNFFACDNCNWDASVITNTPNTVWLDVATCQCTNQDAPYAITGDNASGVGDRWVLFDQNATILDAIFTADGSSEGAGGVIPESASGYTDASGTDPIDDRTDIIGNAATGCTIPAANDYSLPAISDPIYENAGGQQTGCTTSHARPTDGGAAGDWFIDDFPTPGQPNTLPDYEIRVTVDGVTTTIDAANAGSTLDFDICASSMVSFEVDVYGYNQVFNDNDGDNTLPDGTTNLEGGSNRGGSNIDATGSITVTDDPWTEAIDVATGIITLSSTTYNVTGATSFELFVKENTQSSGANNISVPEVPSIGGSGAASECYVQQDIEFNVIDAIIDASFTCDNGLSQVTVNPSSASGLTYTLMDGATVVSSNTSGTFLVTTAATTAYTIEVSQSPACGGPVTATGTVCVFSPPCPDFSDYEACTTAEGALCPNDILTLGLTATDLPQGSIIEWVQLADGDTDPYDNADSDIVATYTVPAPTINIAGAVNYSNVTGNYFGTQDIDGEGAAATQTLTLTGIDIIGQTGLSFCVDMAEDDDGTNQDWDASDEVLFEYNIDGGGNNLFMEVQSSGTNTVPQVAALPSGTLDGVANGAEPDLTDVFTTFNSTIAATGMTMNIIIEFTLNSGDEDIALDNIIIKSNENPGGFYFLDFDTNTPAFSLSTPQFSDGSEDYFGVVSPMVPTTCVNYTIPFDACNTTINVAPRIAPDQTGCNTGTGGPDEVPTLAVRTYTVTCPTAMITGETAICDGAATEATITLGNLGTCTTADITISDGTNMFSVVGDDVTDGTTTITGINMPGIYSISNITLSGCTACDVQTSGDLTVGIASNPATPTGTQTDVCWDGIGSVSIDGISGADDLVWYSDATLMTQVGVGNPFNYIPSATGAVTLHVVSNNADTGCESPALQVDFEVFAEPTLTITPPASAVCNDGSVDVDLTTDITYMPAYTAGTHAFFSDASLMTSIGTTISGITSDQTVYVLYTDANGCTDSGSFTITTSAAVCCTPPTFTAVAACSNGTDDPVLNEYYIIIDAVSASNYDISINSSLVADETDALPFVAGPFTHSGNGTTTSMVQVLDNDNSTCPTTNIVSEVYCFEDTGGTSFAQCGCDTAVDTIFAQTAPGSFDPSTTTMVYILVDDAGNLIEFNNSGLFINQYDGMYQIYAFNVANGDLTAFENQATTDTGSPFSTFQTNVANLGVCQDGCTTPAMFTLDCGPIMCDLASTTDVCGSDTDGMITFNVSGGDETFTFAVFSDPALTTPATATTNFSAGVLTLSGLAAGDYFVEITDGNGCTTVCDGTVMMNILPMFTASAVKNICTGQSLNIELNVSSTASFNLTVTDNNGVNFFDNALFGGFTTYTLPYSNSNTGTPFMGDFTVEITNGNGCSTIVLVPVSIEDCMCVDSETTCGDDPIMATTNGNNTADKDTWFLLVDPATGNIVAVVDNDAMATFPTAALTEMVYQVHVLNFDPSNPPNPIAGSATPTDPTILNNTNIAMIGMTTQGCFNADLCTDYLCYEVVENPVCMATNDGSVCVGDDVTLGASLVSGPAPIDTYSWTGPNTFTSTDAAPMITNVTSADAGTYTVTITDTNGCTTMCSTTVVINENPVVTAIVVKEACIGQDLQFLATATGGSGNYTYAWTDVNGIAFGTGMASETYTTSAVSETGTYTVVVTDATTLCTTMATVNATVIDCDCTPVVICPDEPITVSSINPAPAPKLQWYLLVDPMTGEILDANDTGMFMTTALANGTYQVHALNFDPATPPSPLMTGDVPADLIGVFLGTIGSITQGCFNADLCTEYLCYTIEDTTDPVITMCPADVTIECDESTDPTLNASLGGEPVATDNCTDTPDLTIMFTDVVTPGACADANTITRTWTVTDEADNFTTCVQTITVEDTTPPMMDCTLVDDLIIECNSSDDYTTIINSWITASEMTFDNNATDNCDTDVMISNDWDGSLPTLSCDLTDGNVTITFTATDNCGNIFTCDKDVFLDDSVDPMVTCPADVTFEACGTDVLLTATLNPFSTVSMPLTGSGSLLISDACDTDLTVTYIDDDNGTALCDATNLVVTRTFTVTDDCGNSSTCSQDFVIQDTTPPMITCPADMTMASCTQSTDPSTTGTATATDNCTTDPNDITITFVDAMSPAGCTGDAGIVRTFTATDACGNSSTCVQNIMVVDMDAPTIICPTDLTIECVDGTDYVAAINTWIATATATDVCDMDVAITTDYDGTSTPTACDLVTGLPITFTATDDCGNTDICTASVFINDTQPPMITCPADMTMASCTQSTDPSTTGTATATDACSADADIVIVFSDATSPAGCTGDAGIVRTFTATDACGNSSTCVQNIMVVDMDAPTITCPTDLTIECVDGTDYVAAINTWIATATATDVCDMDVTITTDYDGTSTPTACDLVTGLPITFTATDDCGNSDICTANVFINDTVEPNAVCQNLTINYDLCATVPVMITADQINNGSNDACSADANLTLAIDMDTFDCSNAGDNIVALTVTDECGNTSTCEAIVTIVVEELFPPLVTNDFHCSEKIYDGGLLTAKCQATSCANGAATNVTWWTEATGGMMLGSGDTFDPINDPNFDPTVASCYTYYAQCEFSNGCVSERGQATFQVIDCDVECTDGCLYFLVLEDSANNGWDGASIDVTVNEGTSTNYNLGATGCNNGYQVIPITVNDGGLIDLAYWNGANETEHAWTLFDWSMTTILSTGYDAMGCNTVAPDTAVNTTVRTKAECPECCVDEGNFIVRITMGNFPEEQSWEIYDGIASTTEQGTQVIGINATAYTGLAPGFQITYDIELEKCETYTFAAFDGFNDSWNGGSWEVITSDLSYGNEITNLNDPLYGNSLVLSGPADATFTDEDRVQFTIPCQNCFDDVVNFSDPSSDDCLIDGTLPVNEPFVCYPDCNHALPAGCINDELVILVNGDPSNAVTIPIPVGFDYTTGINVTDLPVGCHKLVQATTYCDGIIAKCTTDLNIVRDINPSLACNDLVNISLNVNDGEQCIVEVTPDMVLELPNACEGEYTVTILDTNGAPLIVYSNDGLPLDNFGNPIPEGNQSIEIAHDFVSGAQAGQTLTYVVEHKFSENKCWGEILIEDKVAPIIVCTDYDLSCTHPEALNENYTHTDVYEPLMELPANIAGGTAGLVSNTFIPVNMPCGALGEVIQNIEVTVDLTHNDVTDLAVFLHLPAALDAALGGISPLQLDATGDVEASNIYTPNPVNDAPSLLALLGAACNLTESTILEDFITENSGNNVPANVGNTWYIQIIDNNATTAPLPPFGGGEVTAASISLICGFPTPVAAFDCTLQSVELINEQLVETNCDQSDWNGAQIVRTWQAIDAFGNSSVCTQTVNLKAPAFSDLIFPEDQALECSDNVDSSVEATGTPAFGCFPIQETQHDVCDIVYTYEDQEFITCGNSKKIFRTWTVMNCCNLNTKLHTQLIKIEDTEGPVINVDDIVANTAVYDCNASIAFNEAITDGCSDVTSIIVSFFEGGGAYNGSGNLIVADVMNGETIDNLPLGVTELLIKAQDGCLNITEEIVSVTISDNTPPVAICDDNLNISLGSDGTARVMAEDIDEGSYDNCGEITLEVRRVDGCLGTTTWAESVPFECCDVNEMVTVELRVTDAGGNTNVCWQQVLVEDALAPSITCPDDITVDCDDDVLHDIASLGDPIAIDNCNVTLDLVETDNRDNCQAGTITRRWTASDGSDKSNDASCTQTITVEHISDFVVQFPADVTVSTCPDSLGISGEPSISDDDCELLAINYDDLVLTIVDDACYVIERTWTIVNWCVYDEGNAANTDLGIPQPLPRTFRDDDGFFTYVQTITVQDSDAPTITCPGDQTFCDLTDGCEGEAQLTIEVEDGCSPAEVLEYTYKIDAFNDGNGEFDIVETGNDATGVYPYGTHLIKWIVEDGCGNTSSCSYLFTIEDCKNPTPVCLNGISLPNMETGCVDVWASDLLEYAFDNCSSDEFVENSVRIRRVGSVLIPQTSITLCCGDLGIVPVEIWVEDEAGNTDFCTTYIEVQDNLGNCVEQDLSKTIAGSVETREGEMVELVEVELTGGMNMEQTTPTAGNYIFDPVSTNMNYTITPEKDIDPLNGVSTFDIVLMSQHILGINELTNPYQMIAADVNNDGNITTFDVVQTRQLILYVISDFPSNTSWRFVPKDFVFVNPTNPWSPSFPEVIDIENLEENRMDADFIGIKIGDVNGDAVPNTLLGTDERNTKGEVIFKIDDAITEPSTSYRVDFRASNFNNLTGYQFTLSYDQEILEFASIEAGAITMKEGNIGRTMLNEGIITASWNLSAQADVSEAINIQDDEVLFSMYFNVFETAQLSEALNIDSRYTIAEAYNNAAELLDVNLEFVTEEETTIASDEFELYQNKPNPFTGRTTIGFNLPSATSATMSVHDVAGKLLRVVEGDFDKGYNEVMIDAKDLKGTGVLYYQLDTPDHSATKKMIILD